MNIFETIKNRRSVRVFTDRQIDKEDIEKIVDAGQWAPSACNKQLWKFIAITDKKTKKDLVLKANSIGLVENAPLVIAVTYPTEVNKEHDANVQSGAAAIQNMLLYSYSLGIGSVWICAYGNDKKVSEILEIPKKYRVIAFVCFGYPKSNKILAPKRKQINKILSYNKFKFDDIYPTSHHLKYWTFRQASDYLADSIYASSPTPEVYMKGFIGDEVREQIGLIKSYLNKNQTILEIFPYTGNFCLNILKNHNLEYTLLESDKKIFDFINKRKKSMNITQNINEYLIKDLKIPLNDNLFDTILFFERVNSTPQLQKIIDEAYRVLKPGGKMIFGFKNKLSFTFAYHLLVNKGELAPYDLFSIMHARNLLEKFKIEKIEGISLTPWSMGKKAD